MKKISIILPNLRGGGAERVAVNLANDWIDRGFNVEFVLMHCEGELLKILNPKISVINFNVKRIRNFFFPLWRYMRNKNFDIAWVNMWPITSIAVLAWILNQRHGKLFITDHNQLTHSCVKELGISEYWLGLLIRFTYPLASGVIGVSKGVVLDLAHLSKLPVEKFEVIYNPAATGVSLESLNVDQTELLWGKGFDYHILAVGSLKAVKNHVLLIDAFSTLSLNVNAKLIILGEGELRPKLEKLIKELNLEARVSMPGFHQNPYPFFQSADLFVLTSNHEGFGNVIVEALECGVPVISTDCPSGPAEILENGLYGRLVPLGDAGALSLAIQESLIESHDHEALIKRARSYSINLISEKYLRLFNLTLNA